MGIKERMSADAKVFEEIVELLLEAYFKERAPDRMVEYVLASKVPHGAPARNFQELIFLKAAALIPPALLLRKSGPRYLQAVSMGEVMSRLRGFIRENYVLIAREMDRKKFETSFAANVSDDGKVILATALSKSEVFHPVNRLLVFPITPMSVETDFVCDDFFFCKPASLPSHLPNWVNPAKITPTTMPPFLNPVGTPRPVEAWLGVRAPADEAAKKTKRIVLGAIALTPLQRDRYMFTLREVLKNYCYFGKESGTISSLAHTPPLGDGIVIRDCDQPWLQELARIIKSDQKADLLKRNALEYFYRAWFLDRVERCPVMFMALDAIFGQEGTDKATAKMKAGIENTLGEERIGEKLNIMMVLRNLVLHGAAPDVYFSSKYRKYYEKFEADLVSDLELITAKCLRKYIFGTRFVPQDDPHAELIAKHQAWGTIPSVGPDSIVVEWP
ncbi:hypothetical protein [Mesorhizobium sp.]|uniref:hypothetical protein n=1 Tax=Mesorhizobium sp. TaxID=1871066 RepID=UPI000FE6A575|nr:hypothetical protein [Mesorhizobium sp.]RWK76788.1 MAG: hypothetical protein EOR50_13720 [Mesorhizobium sp.]RWP80323.1 MAG: hypothetical protein EOR09_00600 [Mesorhizobium sp.]